MTESKKNISPLWIALAGIGIAVLWVMSSYNGLITLDENTNAAFANIETRLQERYDLIPNLISTVKGAADFEQSTLTALTNARTQWQQAKTENEKIAASNEMESALSRLLVTVENYPNLTATKGFTVLQKQIEGMENRIAVERKRYNDAANAYNKKIRTVPTVILANMFGFERHDLFQSVDGAETAPQVKFDFQNSGQAPTSPSQ